MRGRTILSIITCLVLVAALVTIQQRRAPEPRYNGMLLRDCLRSLIGPASADQQLQGYSALSQLGTNDLPYLVEWIQYETPAWHRTFGSAARRLPLRALFRPLATWIARDPREVLAQGATYALITLGNQGRAFSATESLLQVLNKPAMPQTALKALIALTSMGQTAPLILALKQPHHPYQPEMRQAIGSLLIDGPPLITAQVSNELAHLAPDLLTNVQLLHPWKECH